MDLTLLKDHIIWAEGFRQFPYKDSVGILTVAVGRNLEDVGIRKSEAMFMLENDLEDVISNAESLPYWNSLDDVRRLIVADMIFNLGLTRFTHFVKLNKALEISDYQVAAYEMQDSRWATQVGRRATKLIEAMKTGAWK